MANAAVYYAPDGFTTTRDQVMGRHVAGQSFLHGYARYGTAPVLYCFTALPRHFEHFKSNIEKELAARRRTEWIPFARCDLLAGPGCVFHPSPAIGDLAWRRRRFGARQFSICGITHTTASHTATAGIGDLLLAPVQPWDAIICTSNAVRSMVGAVLDQWGSYLRDRLGAARAAPRPQLPVIPLGIDCRRHAPSEQSAQARSRFRRRHGIGEDDVAFLFAGRLSFHAKANPLPMYLALEQAARQTGRRVFLVQAGWFANQPIEAAFRSGAERFCPSVRTIFVDGRQPEGWRAAWAAADVFTSLSDNIQEAFGLTPIEAMAAGLPVVVSDWDGYRDTVEDGVHGFRVATTMPPPPLGEELAWRYAAGLDSYDVYIGLASQFAAVDVAACATAYATLIEQPQRRRAMGEAGRRRAAERHDWSRIIADYEALWAELEARRRPAPQQPGAGEAPAGDPLRDDPFRLFRAYPTFSLDEAAVVRLPRSEADRAFATAARNHPLNAFARPYLPSEAECEVVFDYLSAHRECRVADLLDATSAGERRAVLHRGLAWLAKIGVITMSRGRP